MLNYCWASVADGGPAFVQHHVILLGVGGRHWRRGGNYQSLMATHNGNMYVLLVANSITRIQTPAAREMDTDECVASAGHKTRGHTRKGVHSSGDWRAIVRDAGPVLTYVCLYFLENYTPPPPGYVVRAFPVSRTHSVLGIPQNNMCTTPRYTILLRRHNQAKITNFILAPSYV